MNIRITVLTLAVLMLCASIAWAQDTPANDDALLDEPDATLTGENEAAPAEPSPAAEQAPAEEAPAAETQPALEEPAATPDSAPAPAPAAEEQTVPEVETDTTFTEEELKQVKDAVGDQSDGGNDWSDFPAVRLNFVFSDDNMMDNSEFSPAADIGPRDSQDYSQSHLVLYKRADGYWKGLATEAALVLKFKLYTDSTGSTGTGIGDDGSYVKVGYIFDYSAKRQTELDLTGFPFDADSFLLGYHYNLTWAGESSFPQNSDSVPGMRVGFEHPWFYVFAGMKTHRQPLKDKLNTERVPVETVFAGLFGTGLRPLPVPGLLIEANGGIIEKGDNPLMPEIDGQEDRDDILAWGSSARVSYNWGMPISEALDMNLWQNDPRNRLKAKPEDVYEARRISFLVSGEFNFLSEALQDPDKEDGTKPFNAMAGMLQAKFKYDYLRTHLDFMYRSLEFLLFNTPGFIPFEAFPASVAKRDEISTELAVDYHIKKAHLTLGLAGGMKIPATYKGASNIQQIAVIKDRSDTAAFLNAFDRNVEILPEGKSAANIYNARFNLQFDLSDYMSMLLELSYVNDGNKTRLAESEDNSKLLVKKFEDSKVINMLGIAAMIRAHF